MRFDPMTRCLGLAVSLLVVACGGPETVSDSPQVDADESHHAYAPPPCDSSYLYRYYSDASMTTMVGSRTCTCGLPPGRWGRVTEFVQIIFEDESCPGTGL